MKYIVIILVIIPSIYTISYAKYCWGKKNKTAAVGAILIALSSIVSAVLKLVAGN